MGKNSITTQGYFIKRLRDNGFFTSRVYSNYSSTDKRKWTIAVNPNTDSVLVTCHDNGDWPFKGMYELDDAGQKIPLNFYINTMSVEVVIKHLLDFNIKQLNNYNGQPGQRSTKKASSKAAKETGQI